MGLYLSNGGYRQSNTKKRMKNNTNFSSFIAITTAYWAFMLTDGALRMLVLLHFHTLGISALQLAYIFLIYEFMGVITNLSAGFLAKRFGLKSTLYAGLLLQIFSLLMLSLLQSNWSTVSMVIYATLVQALSGIAKDLTKTSAKSSVKIMGATTLAEYRIIEEDPAVARRFQKVTILEMDRKHVEQLLCSKYYKELFRKYKYIIFI